MKHRHAVGGAASLRAAPRGSVAGATVAAVTQHRIRVADGQPGLLSEAAKDASEAPGPARAPSPWNEVAANMAMSESVRSHRTS